MEVTRINNVVPSRDFRRLIALGSRGCDMKSRRASCVFCIKYAKRRRGFCSGRMSLPTNWDAFKNLPRSPRAGVAQQGCRAVTFRTRHDSRAPAKETRRAVGKSGKSGRTRLMHADKARSVALVRHTRRCQIDRLLEIAFETLFRL